MSLYKINQDILDLIDMETGEILDEKKFGELKLAKKEKLRNIALLAKNCKARMTAFKAEEESFADRRKREERTLRWCEETLLRELNGRKVNDTEYSISYRKSARLEIEPDAKIPVRFLRYPDPVVRKQDLKDAVKLGAQIPGVSIVERQNIIIK